MTGKCDNRRSPIQPGSILMRLAAVLFCLVMISAYLMAGMYARYTTSADSSDTARVAKFSVLGSGSGMVSVDCTQTDGSVYAVTINNASEVAVSYDLDFIFTDEMAKGLSLSLQTSEGGKAGAVSDDGLTVSFADAGTLAPNTEATHNVTFSVSDWSAITKPMSGIADTGKLDFTVHIHAEQID